MCFRPNLKTMDTTLSRFKSEGQRKCWPLGDGAALELIRDLTRALRPVFCVAPSGLGAGRAVAAFHPHRKAFLTLPKPPDNARLCG